MNPDHDETIARVTGALYGALMDARPYVLRRLEIARGHGSDRVVADTRNTLDRVDAALADAADYLESDGS